MRIAPPAVDLREGLERPRDVLRRYADPGVSDDEVDEPGFRLRRADRHATPRLDARRYA